MDRVWMKHPDVGTPALFPARAVAGWKARGYVECEAPPERNRATEHWQKPADPAPETAPAPPVKKTKPKTQEADSIG